jgi:hypothetical protein
MTPAPFCQCARAKEIFDVPATSFCFDKIQRLIDESRFDIKWIPTILTKEVGPQEYGDTISNVLENHMR